MTETSSEGGQAPAAPAAPEAQAPAAPLPPSNTNWRDQLPEELRGAPALQSFQDLPAMAKSYLEAQSRLGSAIRVPSHEAGEEDRAAFRKRVLEVGKQYGITAVPGEGEDATEYYRSLGVPDDVDGYEVPQFDDPDVTVDMSEAATLRATAKELGMTKKQYSEFVKAAAQGRLEQAKAAIQRRDAEHATLHKEWGQAYDERFHQLDKFLEVNSAPRLLRKAVGERQVDAETSRWLYNLMESIGGDTSEIAAQGKNGNSNALTPAEAMDRVTEIENRMRDMNPGDTEYQQLIDARLKYMRMAG